MFKLHAPLPFLFDIAQNSHIVMVHLMKTMLHCDMDLSGFFSCVNVTWRRLDEIQTLMDDLLHWMCQAENVKGAGHLIIMNNRGAAFYFLLFFYFLFLLVVCRLWGLVCVLHGVSALRSGTSDGALFHDSLLWSDKDDAEWWTVWLRLEVEDKNWTMMKLRDSAFHIVSWFFN